MKTGKIFKEMNISQKNLSNKIFQDPMDSLFIFINVVVLFSISYVILFRYIASLLFNETYVLHENPGDIHEYIYYIYDSMKLNAGLTFVIIIFVNFFFIIIGIIYFLGKVQDKNNWKPFLLFILITAVNQLLLYIDPFNIWEFYIGD